MIRAISKIESRAMEDVSFYKETRRFVEIVKQRVDEGVYKGVVVIGHSLGGGLSMINGAQENVKSFALSGPNVILTRKSLEPVVSRQELDTYTFNVIPERDLITMVDNPAKNNQRIRCRGDESNLAACHDAKRSICEILYSCGSSDRPVLCECVSSYGYPAPSRKYESNTTETFQDVCK